MRLTPTRFIATELCRAGRVTVNGNTGKAASPVRVGDRIEARIADRVRVVEVAKLVHKRVGAPIAAECLIDHSPPVVKADDGVPIFRRDRGAGRPTKRDRRQLDRLRGDPG